VTISMSDAAISWAQSGATLNSQHMAVMLSATTADIRKMALAAEEQLADANTYQVEIHTRDGRLTNSASPQSLPC
jgi:hypothetical protein